jgi:hypothetical protein
MYSLYSNCMLSSKKKKITQKTQILVKHDTVAYDADVHEIYRI